MGLKPCLICLGRFLLALIFLMSGFGKAFRFQQTQQYMAAFGMPATAFFLVLAILVEILGGISVVLGYRSRWGAFILSLFLTAANLIFHKDFSDPAQVAMFFKNLSVLGGLLLLFAYGPGEISWDRK